MSLTNFVADKTSLSTGITLIEASAGTGKTYTIAMLVLRYVVEQEIDIKQILVVTFTKVATEELKERIRLRLEGARQIAMDRMDSSITNAHLDDEWLSSLTIEPKRILQRLNNALLDIDQAAIFTIHGFCQRTLSEYALESGQLFDSELTGDVSSIKQACSDDFWRKTIYPRSAWEVSLLTETYQTPDKLLASVNFISPDLNIIPEYESIDQKLIDLKKLMAEFKQEVGSCLNSIKEKLKEDKFKPAFKEGFPTLKKSLLDWFNDKSLVVPSFSILTEQRLCGALNGHKFKKSKANPLSSAEQKSAYLESLAINTQVFELLDSAIKGITLCLRRSLLDTLHKEINTHLQKLNVLSFDDLITRLADALCGEKGQGLCAEIQQQYQVALIDEFQDTDQSQWFIFDTLFNSADHALYLIGDPKQAIYKFRGADIQSYFSAKTKAKQTFSLGYNWRSHPHLVEGVNKLFERAAPFLSDNLEFYPTTAKLTAEQGTLTQNDRPVPPLILWQLEKIEKGYWTSGKATEEIIMGVVNEILDLLLANYCIRGKTNNSIQPADIAILVKTNAQAVKFQSALNEVGINSAINSKQSVFASQEASDFSILLQAITKPADSEFLKRTLALNWFGLNGQDLLQLLSDEFVMDGWFSRLQNYQSVWQKKGLMAMMQQLLVEENIFTHFSKNQRSERRITDLLHCIELVQQAAIDNHLGMNKTLDWLQDNITQTLTGNAASDEQQLRLESDENSVIIMTMHSSKGLEYPIVFCPFLWQRGNYIKSEKEKITCHKEGQLIVDLGSSQFEYHRDLALTEELEEDVRVFYVAVTRAKYRCYINWANVRSKEKANDSAMAYLMDFDKNDSIQEEKLQRYSDDYPQFFEYRVLEKEQKTTRYWQADNPASQLSYKQRQRSLFTYWQMSSYTALSYLSIHEAPELPYDKAREDIIIEPAEPVVYNLPRGAHTGNVIHDLLENIPFKQLAESTDISLQRDQSCLRYGLKLSDPTLIDQLLTQTVSTSLFAKNECFKLRDLEENQCLKEMPFYLSMKTMDARSINQILKECPTYQPLSTKLMCGYLTGFIDLVCEYQGKFYIMDYKSNGLETYNPKSLINAMREHNYGLQYWIYSLVLNKYLTNRLPNYSYEVHFGGVMYLFVRGMDERIDNSGVYWDRPELEKLEQLERLFI